jgi:hypothetical protein
MVFKIHQKPFFPFDDYRFGLNIQIKCLAQKFTMF